MKTVFIVNKFGISILLVLGIIMTTASSMLPADFSLDLNVSNLASSGSVLPNVPAYFSSTALWDQAVTYAPAGSILVMNPANGPGTSINSNYLASAIKARLAGINVLGYVDTEYGKRSLTTVKKEIDFYRTMYGVTSVFFSRASNLNSKISYYKTLADYVHSTPGAIVEIDPGTSTIEGYMAVADIIVTYDGNYTKYGSAATATWTSRYPSSRFAHIVVNVPDTASALKVITLAKQRNAGYVYVTDDSGRNPYDRLPGYWADPQLLAQYPSANPTPTAVPTEMATPTAVPTLAPTSTALPTEQPTLPAPTQTPTTPVIPTVAITPIETSVPTHAPTATSIPTQAPTATTIPTQALTATSIPTQAPTATSLPTQAPTSVPNSGGLRINVPAYFYDADLWNQAVAIAPAGSILIMNPNDGPGTAADAGYVAAVAKAKAAGIIVMGYVETSYGDRSLTAVKNDINAYKSLYGVTSIFLDQASNLAGDLAYYQTLGNYIHANLGGLVEINPGTSTLEDYMAVADIVMTYANTYEEYLGHSSPSWVYNYPASKFAHVVYAASDSTAAVNALSLAKQRNAGYVYVTNDVEDNPFDSLPAYWNDSQVLAQYSIQAPAPTQTPTATAVPTQAPTATSLPTQMPTATMMPTQAPTATKVPTQAPTTTKVPTQAPTTTTMPTQIPTSLPNSGCILQNVPAYFYEPETWGQAIANSPAGSILIMNPYNGPGSGVDPNYAATIAKAKAAGVIVMGYVATNYGDRSLTSVKNDINAYKSLYGVTSIFLDETSNLASDFAYYQTLGNYIHTNLGGLVEINPGTSTLESYMAVADIVMTYESPYNEYAGGSTPAWVYKYPASKFAHVVIDVPDAASAANVVSLARQRNVGYIYITNDSGSNPYDTLPAYWNDPQMLSAFSCGVTAANLSMPKSNAMAVPTLTPTVPLPPTLVPTETTVPTLIPSETASPTATLLPVETLVPEVLPTEPPIVTLVPIETLAPTEPPVPTLAPTEVSVPSETPVPAPVPTEGSLPPEPPARQP